MKTASDRTNEDLAKWVLIIAHQDDYEEEAMDADNIEILEEAAKRLRTYKLTHATIPHLVKKEGV